MKRHFQREELSAALRWLSTAGLTGLLALHIARSGPLKLEAPKTVLSQTLPALEELILFLREVSRRAPGGATIAILQGEEGVSVYRPVMVSMLAAGQLPQQHVVHADSFETAIRSAEYIAVFGGSANDPRLALLARLPRGALYRRKP